MPWHAECKGYHLQFFHMSTTGLSRLQQTAQIKERKPFTHRTTKSVSKVWSRILGTTTIFSSRPPSHTHLCKCWRWWYLGSPAQGMGASQQCLTPIQPFLGDNLFWMFWSTAWWQDQQSNHTWPAALDWLGFSITISLNWEQMTRGSVHSQFPKKLTHEQLRSQGRAASCHWAQWTNARVAGSGNDSLDTLRLCCTICKIQHFKVLLAQICMTKPKHLPAPNVPINFS